MNAKDEGQQWVETTRNDKVVWIVPEDGVGEFRIPIFVWDRLNALQQQVTELEGRLKKYGQHARGCNTGDPFYGLPCSCGLEAPLTSPSTIAQKEMASE